MWVESIVCNISVVFLGHSVYDEAMAKEVANDKLGIEVGGQVVSVIRYADDKAVVANSEKNLQRLGLMDNISEVTARDYGMRINVKTAKVKCISWQCKLR